VAAVSTGKLLSVNVSVLVLLLWIQRDSECHSTVIWKVDGNENEYEQQWNGTGMGIGWSGNEKPTKHTSSCMWMCLWLPVKTNANNRASYQATLIRYMTCCSVVYVLCLTLIWLFA